MGEFTDLAEREVKEYIEEYISIVSNGLLDDGRASDDINEYGSGEAYYAEYILDRDYQPREAVELIEELSNDEETDESTWSGVKGIRGILSAIASRTYGNRFLRLFGEKIEEINSIDVDFAKEEVIEELTNEDGYETESPSFNQEKWEEENDKRIISALRDRIEERIREIIA